ncbi:MAG: hypothetical protein A3F95_00570 [Candidatus Nealsonbacteria bacterium RIFCSPLOWO2_12_FULL_39_31]|uniref:Ferredoxin n=3 Tax=Candidatus Nealsoniibacteriota TaxID=1817911 RepID=A0A1G2EEU4_9BACT|nr:MAG: Ferredoxin [Parcubacteria group bacterium GW2011_GWA2_38_27]KKQ97383.1 MAG: Ferredoxin [Parcubacteria group bacterium GW2011_GWC2_39_11]OGZ20279.1 MAG: hypothetical protein A2626_01425 [Candidatus Nealsonbacteria bacterium RIFCSPHIGHO2_01_FULL_38_55]OGZ20852.1 MAG: hypothetical protein A2W55_00615 [Candidatus Nealsonbacteria bacterium RIFCSPHIGHO2_02_38_10]OGZ21817.1 MAG: hypothetical protein A3C48_01185 [Candidatus Nealsonbacteria bacterium RIFCSPHIGHO2_02_FULL_38_75]OGZ22502.1 MAG: h
MKIIHNRGICIGCGSCAAVCPKHWKMGNDGKSTLLSAKDLGGEKYELDVSKIECNQEAADICPVQCIGIEK